MEPKVESYFDEHKDRFVEELMMFLRFASISTDLKHREDVQECAKWLKYELMMGVGLSDVEIFATGGHPIVYGQWCEAGPAAPTILLYGHYDVQPVDPLELWSSDPFKPTIKDGKIYARGATDDKGQVWLQLKAVEAWLKGFGALPVNVKILIEGEEEIGSVHLYDFVKEQKDLLAADMVLISDTAMPQPGIPAVCYGLRGLSYLEVHVHGPNRDLHSGSFGGAVDNPVNVLCWMISQLKDRNGKISIPGFYDNVRGLSEVEKNAIARVPFDPEKFAADIGVPQIFGEAGYTPLEWLWTRPTLDVNGIWGGFQGTGAKTIIPASASAKISMRLVPDQTPEEIAQKFIQYCTEIAPPTVQVEIQNLYGGEPFLVNPESLPIQTALQVLEKVYQTPAVLVREGGSIPIVSFFQKELEADPILMGFGLPTECAHSPNEHFHLDNFYKGMRAVALFFSEIAQRWKDRDS